MVEPIKLIGRKKSGKSGGSANSEDPNTLITNTIAKAVYLFSEGPVEGLATGDGKSIYFNDIPLIDSIGGENFHGVAWTFRNGLPDQDIIPGMGSPVSTVSLGTKVTFASPVSASITGSYDAVNVTISIPALTAADTTTGTLKGTDLSYSIEVKTSAGSFVTVVTENLVKQKTTSEWQKTYRVELPPGGSPWTVRVNRLTADSASVNVQNDLYFSTYGLVVSGKFNYRNSCVLGLQLNAKEFQQEVPTIKCRIKGIKVWVPTNYDPVTRVYATTGTGTSGGIWDGTFKAAWTDNPVWIYNDLIINNRYGLGQDFNPSDIAETAFVDKWALYTISQFCDELIDNGYGGTEPRYSMNIQITDKQEAYQLLQQIISSVNGMIYFSGEQIVAVSDIPSGLDDIYSQADVVEGIFEYSGTSLRTRHSAVITYWNDPNNLFKRSSVVWEDSNLIDRIGYRVAEINLFGCTSRGQAIRAAKWLLQTEKTQTQTVTFKTGHRGGFLTPGNIIKIFDDYKAGERRGGRILSYEIITGGYSLTLDQQVSAPAGDSFLYISEDGEVVTYVLTYDQLATGFIVVPNTSPPPITAGGSYALISPDLDGQLYRILAVQETESDVYTVIGLEHNESKYAIIDATPFFPDLPTSIYTTSALKPPTSLTISPWYEEILGSQTHPHITASWERPDDNRVTGYELQLKSPLLDYTTVFEGLSITWDSGRLSVDTIDGYSARVRSTDALGRVSIWTYNAGFSVPGKETAPEPPTNIAVVGVPNGYRISWTNPINPDHNHVEVWHSATNDINTKTLIAEVRGTTYTYQGLYPGDIRYIWLRSARHALTLQFSTFTTSYKATATSITPDDVDNALGRRGVQIAVTGPNDDFLSVGDGQAYFFIPSILSGMYLQEVHARVTTASTSGIISVMLTKANPGSGDVDLLTTALTIDATEYTSKTAATAEIIDSAVSSVILDDVYRIDINSAGADAKGLIVTLIFGHTSTTNPSVCDLYYTSTVLLMKFNSSNGSNVFPDNSFIARGNATAVGGAIATTATYKFGTASSRFDGAGDYLTYADSNDFSFGTGDFTIDTWVQFADAATLATQAQTIASKWDDSAGTDLGWFLHVENSSVTFAYSVDGTAGGSAPYVIGSYSFAVGQWYHIAVDRSVNVVRIYVNGAMIASYDPGTTNVIFNNASVLRIGANYTITNYLNGFLDDFRITKGVARYASNSGFTVPSYQIPTFQCT